LFRRRGAEEIAAEEADDGAQEQPDERAAAQGSDAAGR
jgi:hypothetical protein